MQKIPFPEHIRGQSPNTSCSKQTHGRRTVRSGIDSFHRRTSGAGIAPEAFHFSGAQTGQADRKGRCPYRWKTDRANCTVAKDTPKTARPKKRQKGPARDANISIIPLRQLCDKLVAAGFLCRFYLNKRHTKTQAPEQPVWTAPASYLRLILPLRLVVFPLTLP